MVEGRKLTAHEHMLNTVKLMKIKEEGRLKGIRDAREYGYEMRYKAYKRKSKIRLKKYGGR